MSNQAQNPNDKKYDLKERTSKFGEDLIVFVSKLERNPINNPLVSQLVRSCTSIGANYMEADGAESRLDFKHKIAICKKEAKETTHWCKMLAAVNPQYRDHFDSFYKEAHELVLIFSSILNSMVKSE